VWRDGWRRGIRDGVGAPDELGHGEAAAARCDLAPRIERWIGVGPSGGVGVNRGLETL